MSIPYLAEDKGGKYFVVNDQPFLALGGELHNSSGADLRYMEEIVWPALRKIGGNFYLIPAYWEYVEPEEGVYNFDLVDGLIDQARREGVKLGLLWFGTWKNGASDYLPQWLKEDTGRYFLARDEKGQPLNVVSPLCTAVRDLDAKAFAALMKHLKEIDEEENTVITVQVENEVGIWMHARDFCEESNAAFEKEIPEEVSELFGVKGAWEESFGVKACQQFEAYHYAKYIEYVASAGKKEYPIPLYVNCVASAPTGGIGFSPAGGPDHASHKMYMHFAPTIDIISPDVYSPNYPEVIKAFHHDGNPLFIPETNTGKDSASKLIYAMGAHNCIGFNPFGCEDFYDNEVHIPDIDWANNGFMCNFMPLAGERLHRAYEITWALWPEIRKAHAEGRIHAFYQSGPAMPFGRGEKLEIQDYTFLIGYGKGSSMGPRPAAPNPDAPLGAGLIIERGEGEFLLFGVNCNLKFEPLNGKTGVVIVADKKEIRLDDGTLNEGRSLNGDERNVTGIGETPNVITFKLKKYL